MVCYADLVERACQAGVRRHRVNSALRHLEQPDTGDYKAHRVKRGKIERDCHPTSHHELVEELLPSRAPRALRVRTERDHRLTHQWHDRHIWCRDCSRRPAASTSLVVSSHSTIASTVLNMPPQDALTSILQVAIILGITTCPGNSCPIINPSSPGGVGDVLFSGPWDPQANGPPQLGFHQNFTVEVPQLPSGEALLTLTHLELVGVSKPLLVL